MADKMSEVLIRHRIMDLARQKGELLRIVAENEGAPPVGMFPVTAAEQSTRINQLAQGKLDLSQQYRSAAQSGIRRTQNTAKLPIGIAKSILETKAIPMRPPQGEEWFPRPSLKTHSLEEVGPYLAGPIPWAAREIIGRPAPPTEEETAQRPDFLPSPSSFIEGLKHPFTLKGSEELERGLGGGVKTAFDVIGYPAHVAARAIVGPRGSILENPGDVVMALMGARGLAKGVARTVISRAAKDAFQQMEGLTKGEVYPKVRKLAETKPGEAAKRAARDKGEAQAYLDVLGKAEEGNLTPEGMAPLLDEMRKATPELRKQNKLRESIDKALIRQVVEAKRLLGKPKIIPKSAPAKAKAPTPGGKPSESLDLQAEANRLLNKDVEKGLLGVSGRAGEELKLEPAPTEVAPPRALSPGGTYKMERIRDWAKGKISPEAAKDFIKNPEDAEKVTQQMALQVQSQALLTALDDLKREDLFRQNEKETFKRLNKIAPDVLKAVHLRGRHRGKGKTPDGKYIPGPWKLKPMVIQAIGRNYFRQKGKVFTEPARTSQPWDMTISQARELGRNPQPPVSKIPPSSPGLPKALPAPLRAKKVLPAQGPAMSPKKGAIQPTGETHTTPGLLSGAIDPYRVAEHIGPEAKKYQTKLRDTEIAKERDVTQYLALLHQTLSSLPDFPRAFLREGVRPKAWEARMEHIAKALDANDGEIIAPGKSFKWGDVPEIVDGLSPAEFKVYQGIRAILDQIADRLDPVLISLGKLPVSRKTNYLSHLFERSGQGRMGKAGSGRTPKKGGQAGSGGGVGPLRIRYEQYLFALKRRKGTPGYKLYLPEIMETLIPPSMSKIHFDPLLAEHRWINPEAGKRIKAPSGEVITHENASYLIKLTEYAAGSPDKLTRAFRESKYTKRMAPVSEAVMRWTARRIQDATLSNPGTAIANLSSMVPTMAEIGPHYARLGALGYMFKRGRALAEALGVLETYHEKSTKRLESTAYQAFREKAILRMFSESEAFVRGATGIGAYLKALDMKHPDPVGYARDIVRKTQISFLKADTAPLFRSEIGRFVLMYGRWPAGYLQYLTRMSAEGLEGLFHGDPKKAIPAMRFIVGVAALQSAAYLAGTDIWDVILPTRLFGAKAETATPTLRLAWDAMRAGRAYSPEWSKKWVGLDPEEEVKVKRTILHDPFRLLLPFGSMLSKVGRPHGLTSFDQGPLVTLLKYNIRRSEAGNLIQEVGPDELKGAVAREFFGLEDRAMKQEFERAGEASRAEKQENAARDDILIRLLNSIRNKRPEETEEIMNEGIVKYGLAKWREMVNQKIDTSNMTPTERALIGASKEVRARFGGGE